MVTGHLGQHTIQKLYVYRKTNKQTSKQTTVYLMATGHVGQDTTEKPYVSNIIFIVVSGDWSLHLAASVIT